MNTRGRSVASITRKFDVKWTAGRHTFQFDLTPLTPGVKQTTQLEMHVDDVIVRGPVDRSQWVRPANYARYFPEQNTPEDAAGRKAAAKKLLRDFATRAFRPPADEPAGLHNAEQRDRRLTDPRRRRDAGARARGRGP